MTKLNGAQFTLFPATVITTALTGQAQTAVDDTTLDYLSALTNLTIEAILTYGSGGTTINVYVQTSLDGGATWFDIANFSFGIATASKISAISANIAPAAQAFTPTDGSLTANTIIQGVLGDRFRVKLTTTGTYATSTTLKVVCQGRN